VSKIFGKKGSILEDFVGSNKSESYVNKTIDPVLPPQEEIGFHVRIPFLVLSAHVLIHKVGNGSGDADA
jgi:hypothetical protein